METLILSTEPLPDTGPAVTLDFFDPTELGLRGTRLPQRKEREGRITFNPDGCQIFTLSSGAGTALAQTDLWEKKRWDVYFISIPFTLHKVPGEGFYKEITFLIEMADQQATALDLFPRHIETEAEATLYTISPDFTIIEADTYQNRRQFRFTSLRPTITAFGEGDSTFYWVYEARPEQQGVEPETKHVVLVLRVPSGAPSVAATISAEAIIARPSSGEVKFHNRKTEPFQIQWELRKAPPFDRIDPAPTRPENVAPMNVDAGIIIALKEEFRELFREFVERHVAIKDSENNYYYVFEHARATPHRPYRCVATFVGDMGPLKAGLATQNLINEWNPHTLVMLGIAGALSDDVNIGDVVIASQVDAYMESSKAVQASNQDEYTLRLGGTMYPCSIDLLRFTRNFEFVHQANFSRWQEQCKAELQKLLLEERLERLLTRGVLGKLTQLVDGHIASGPTVGGTQAFTNWLKKVRDRNYLAIEMEAAGFMEAIYQKASPGRTLVLRAISDYADRRKSDLDKLGKGAFRRYAMHNAIQLLWSLFDAGILSDR